MWDCEARLKDLLNRESNPESLIPQTRINPLDLWTKHLSYKAHMNSRDKLWGIEVKSALETFAIFLISHHRVNNLQKKTESFWRATYY